MGFNAPQTPIDMEEIGVQAITFLQEQAGVMETDHSARVKWRELTAHQQAIVLDEYQIERNTHGGIANASSRG
jgi:hypothetical protein